MKLLYPTRSLIFAALLGLSGILPLPEQAKGDLLVSSGDGSILRYDGMTGAFVGPFVAAGILGGQTKGTAFGPDGNFYVSDTFITNTILRFNGTTGAFIDTFASAGGLFRPFGLAFGPDANLYVADFGNNRVVRYDGTTGTLIDIFVPANSGGLQSPTSLSFGPNADLYVSTANADVRRYNGTTGAFINATSANSQLLDLAVGPDSNIYVTALQGNSILRYGTTLNFIDAFVSPGSGGLFGPDSLVFGADGDLYVTSREAGETVGSVLRYDGPSGKFVGAFVPEGSGGLTAPTALFFAPHPLAAIPEPSSLVLLFSALLIFFASPR